MKQSGKRCEMKFKDVQLYTEEFFQMSFRSKVSSYYVVHCSLVLLIV